MKKEKEEGESITTLKDFLLSAIFQSWQKFYFLNFLTFFFNFQTSSVSGELSTSTMTYTPRSEDSGKTLHCRATNPEMHQGVLEDQWKLDVQCKSVGGCKGLEGESRA